MLAAFRKIHVIVLFTLLIPATLSTSAFALEARKGDTIVVRESEVVKEDLYIAGDTATIEGTIEGDLWSACRYLEVHGSVDGSIFAVGGTIMLAGDVKNGVKAIGGNLGITGSIGHDLFLIGNEVSIDSTAVVGGDLFFAAKEALVEGPVGGGIKGAAKTVILGNSVGDDVLLYIRYLTLLEEAHIGGSLTYTSEEEALVRAGARIDGTTTRFVPEYRKRIREIIPFIVLAGVVGKIFLFLMTVIVGLALILAVPKTFLLLSEGIRRKPGASAGWGALILIGVPIAVAIAFGTIVGIGIALVAAAAYFIALYVGHIAISLCIGRLILGQAMEVRSKGALFGSLVLGLFIITLLRFVPVLGYFVWFAASLFGLGSIVAALLIRKESSKK